MAHTQHLVNWGLNPILAVDVQTPAPIFVTANAEAEALGNEYRGVLYLSNPNLAKHLEICINADTAPEVLKFNSAGIATLPLELNETVSTTVMARRVISGVMTLQLTELETGTVVATRNFVFDAL
ncbi:hypothetical protein FGG79_04565 [Bacillus sp. BHET2]|uniref:hypothetical protein n=1 Tax=Bacillus sp. BHET2 TaxID=2583818 RepID=UPI00110F6977|nr:hypothetical protein [Bacillus sp. BHET2]TMU87404.1 hypothetical protein FGG79_04565 [Bacillus sp. BHET2]